jgi:hypothetical protein
MRGPELGCIARAPHIPEPSLATRSSFAMFARKDRLIGRLVKEPAAGHY